MDKEFNGFFSGSKLGILFRNGRSTGMVLFPEKLIVDSDKLTTISRTFSGGEQEVILRSQIISIGNSWLGSVVIVHSNPNLPSPLYFQPGIMKYSTLFELLRNKDFPVI